MKRLFKTTFLVLIILTFSIPVVLSMENPLPVEDIESLELETDLPKRYIVSYYPNQRINIETEKSMMFTVDNFEESNSELEIIEVMPGETELLVLDALKNDPAVRLIEEDKKRFMMEIPNDEYYSTQWSLNNIMAYEAWQLAGSLERPIKVAAIDSGIDTNHPDLLGRITYGGMGFLNGSLVNNIEDSIGHGTGVAGVIAAQTGNNIGVAGVSGILDVSVLPLKVFWDSTSCYVSDVINAVDYAILQNVDVINMSLGSLESSQLEMEAVQRALDAGIVVVASAGNNGNQSTAGQYVYPASYEGVISVGAISENNSIAYYSNYNDKVTLVAPGSYIKTTYLNGSYTNCSGTSFSAPVISAIAAVIKGENPDYTIEEIKSKLESSTVDLGVEGKDSYYGAGSINFKEAIEGDASYEESNGIIESFIFDKNGIKVIVPIDGLDGFAMAYSTKNNLYQYLSGDEGYPIVYGLKSGSKYMEIGGAYGYAINYSVYTTSTEAMYMTLAISDDIVNTFYSFIGFDENNDAILKNNYIFR